jgi:hypothetical protein
MGMALSLRLCGFLHASGLRILSFAVRLTEDSQHHSSETAVSLLKHCVLCAGFTLIAADDGLGERVDSMRCV